MLNDLNWQALEESAYGELQIPRKQDAKETIIQDFQEDVTVAK